MGEEDEVFLSRIKLDLCATRKVLHKQKENAIAAETPWLNSCEYLQQVSVVSWKLVWKNKNGMQAEGGFGSRQFGIGCLDSVIEFGSQSIH